MKIAIPRSFLLLFSLLIFSAPLQGNPFVIDTTKIYKPSANWQNDPAVAYDGLNFLVVWQAYGPDFGSPHKKCARINSNGELLDTIPITFSLSYSWLHGECSIASSDSNSLVTWTYTTGGGSGIYGRRVSLQGQVLDQDDILISREWQHPRHGAAAFDGTNYFVVWEDYLRFSQDSSYKYLRGARVGTDGIVIDSAPFTFKMYNSNDYDFKIRTLHLNPQICTGSNCNLLTWNFIDSTTDHTHNIYGLRISQSGAVLDSNAILISSASGNQINSCVAFDGTNFLVAWEDLRIDSISFKPSIYFTYLDTAGNVLDSSGIPLLPDSGCLAQKPSVCFGLNQYVISYTDSRGNPIIYDIDNDIYISRLDEYGNQLDTAEINLSLSTQHQRHPACSFDGQNHLVVWEDQVGDDSDILGALIDTSGNIITPPGIFVITSENYDQKYPEISFVEPYYMVIWNDYRDNDFIPRLYGTRIMKDGTVCDPNGIHFALIDTLCAEEPHHAISDDDSNFIILQQLGGVNRPYFCVAFRVDSAGTMLDPGCIKFEQPSYRPSIAYDGINWLTTYRGNAGLVAVRLSREGEFLPPYTVVNNGGYVLPRNPSSVVFNGENYLVTWTDQVFWSPDSMDIYGSRIGTDGIDLDLTDILIADFGKGVYSVQNASCGGNAFVTWIDTRNDNHEFEDKIKTLFGTYVSPDGIVLDSVGIQLTPSFTENKEHSVIASTGNKYFICYTKYEESPYGSYRIMGQFIDALVNVGEKNKAGKYTNMLERILPNPGRANLSIHYQVQRKGLGKIYIYDQAGRLVRKLVERYHKPGAFFVKWDGKSGNGKRVGSGIYFVRFSADTYTSSQKFIYIE